MKMKTLIMAMALIFTVSVASAQSNKTTRDCKKVCKKECVEKKACTGDRTDCKKKCTAAKKSECTKAVKPCCK